MKREPLSEASTPRPHRRWGRTLFELLEARVLYSADVTTFGISPLLYVAGAARSSLLGGAVNRQVEVATVQSTGIVGPLVRIDVTRLTELRVDAAERRGELFQKAAERSSLLWSPSDEWTMSPDRSGSPDGDDVSESHDTPTFNSTNRSTRIEMRAARVARAWNRAQEPSDSDLETDGALGTYMSPHASVGGGIDIDINLDRAPWTPPIIAIVDRGDIIPFSPAWEPIFTWSPGGDLFGSIAAGPVSDGVSSASPSSDPHGPTHFSSGGDSSGAMSTTSADTQLYVLPSNDGADVGAAQQLVAGGHVRSAGPAGKTRSPVAAVTRAEEEEEAHRADSGPGVTGGAARATRSSRESVIAGDGDASLIGGDASGHNLAGGTRAGMAGITTTASLLGGGATGEGSAGISGGNTIVVAANGISAVAAAAGAVGGGWMNRAANGAGLWGGTFVNGAWLGARRALEMARGMATAVEGVAVQVLPDAGEMAAATGSATFNAVPDSTNMLLGLAPVWNWGGNGAAGIAGRDGWVDPETLAKAWRMAAAGSLIVTLAGCWYCATATRRADRIRRRLADRARFNTARRIRFNPRPA